MAAVRRVLNHEHHFELVITRVYEEGEEQLLEEDDECESSLCLAASPHLATAADHERPFLIDEQLEFRSATFESQPTFVWRDPESGEDHYEFVASGTNVPTMEFFRIAVFKAMFERKYMRSSEDATEAQLSEFIFTYVWAKNGQFVLTLLTPDHRHRARQRRARSAGRHRTQLPSCPRNRHLRSPTRSSSTTNWQSCTTLTKTWELLLATSSTQCMLKSLLLDRTVSTTLLRTSL